MGTHVSDARFSIADHSEIRTTVEWKKQAMPLFSWQRAVKWFGMLSSGLLGAAAVAPGAFGIPADLQPWAFVIAIFWLSSFCAGMFDL